MKKQTKKHFFSLIAIASSIFILLISLFFYNLYIRDEIDSITNRSLDQLVDNSVQTFRLSLESDISLLESTAALLPVWDYLRYIDFESEDYDYLKRRFDYMAVVNPSGYAVGSDGVVSDLSERKYFIAALDGQTAISEPLESYFDGEDAIFIGTPMIAHGETRGVLVGTIYLDTLDKMFGDSIEGLSANLIIDSNGDIIANGVEDSEFSRQTNLYETISKNNLEDSDELELLQSDVIYGKSGSRTLTWNDEDYHLLYESVGVSDWMVISIMPDSVLQSTTNSIVIVTAAISLTVAIIVGGFAVLFNSSRKRTLKKIAEIAYTSQITGINTVVKFKLDSSNFLKNSLCKNFLLVKFDIENFRLLNESLGVLEGDRMLQCMATAINAVDNDTCIKAHIHADEFLVLIPYNTNPPEQWRDDYETRLLQSLGKEFTYTFRIVAGYYYFTTNDYIDISTAIERVNIAHRLSKEKKSFLTIYSDDILAEAMDRKKIENCMELALQDEEFIMVLQPELDLQNGKLIAAEALVRWHTPNGVMTPDEFIPVFEQNGFILKLDMYMFENACKYLSTWIESGRAPFLLSVNFSKKHFYSIDFVSTLSTICQKYSVPPQYLGIEITERSMLSNEHELISLVHQLQHNGFKVLMDDFGSGYSSLGLLKNTPVDILKLDKSFFTDMEDRSRSLSVVSGVIQLTKALNIKTVAEGIETLADARILKQLGCDILQGYYYSKPLSQDEFKTFYNSLESTMYIDD